jgi:acyl dehydratase
LVRDPKQRPTVPFDRIEPGTPLGTFHYEVTPELVERHLVSTEQQPQGDFAPISMLAADGVNLADQFWDISQSVHAGQQLEVLALPRIGDTLTVTGTALERFVKRGRRYVVTGTQTANADGEVIARGRTTGVIVYSEGSEQAERSAPALEEPVLETLGPLTRTMTLEAMRLYEPPGEENIHTSHERAVAAGLPGPIATGTLFLAYAFDLLQRSYGDDSRVGTEIDVRIRLPVFVGDRIETRAEVVGREGGRVRHRVRCTGPSGDVIRGTASVPV